MPVNAANTHAENAWIGADTTTHEVLIRKHTNPIPVHPSQCI